MDFEVPENLTEEEDKALDTLDEKGRKALAELAEKAEKGTATQEDGQVAQQIAADIRRVRAERESRTAANDDILGLVNEFENDSDDEETEPEAEAEEPAAEEEPVEEPVAEEPLPDEEKYANESPAEAEAVEGEVITNENEQEGEQPMAESITVRERVAASGRTKPPAPRQSPVKKAKVTAAADVGFAAGSDLDGMRQVAEAFQNRSRGFVQPGTGAAFQVAQIRRDAYEGLTTDGGNDDYDTIQKAGRESRLPGNSLTAAAGWCAPSETLYDLCDNGASTEGMVDLPEVQVNRGGVRFTNGPDFSALYSGGFHLTEAQAIAGDLKNCIEIPCPPFEEVRLDAVGICLTSPILMERGYPELVQAFLSEALVAHQWNVNTIMLSKMVAAAGDPIQAGNIGSVAAGALASLELIVQSERDNNKWGLTETVEVKVPQWVFGVMRLDFSLRNGVNMESVSDNDIKGWFADRNISIEGLLGWQSLPEFTGATAQADVGYPGTFDALVYRAGTFVKGTQDVINLSAVHDSGNLKQNLYTALFFEEAVLLLQRCYGAKAVTVPVCAGGKTGAAVLETCNIAGEVVEPAV